MADLTYRSYLRLPELLDCQTPLSDAHDELLFLSIHQASEIWLKLALHELTAARGLIAADDLPPALKMMARVGRIMAQLIGSWEILATMTPADYASMRGKLGASSGFQSDQYRRIEFLLGNKNVAMLRPFAGEPDVQAVLSAELARPSLYDEAVRLLARRGFAIAADRLDRDWTATTASHPLWRPPGPRSTPIPGCIGTCTSWPRSWSTSTIASSCGASATSRRWSG